MNDVFSDFLRRLPHSGELQGQEDYDEVCGHLRAVLITELRRRGLWSASPAVVGLLANSWQDRDALDELVADAYTYIFIRRLEGLRNQLKIKPNIDGLVVRNVRHFLTDRQRKADPLGYRVYTRLRGAIERLLQLGRLFLKGHTAAPQESPPPEVHNGSTLSFDSKIHSVLAHPTALEGPAKSWNDRRMPDLVTAEGHAVPKVVEDLAEDVATLPDDGVQAFRFQHLAKALKDDARGRWKALWVWQQDTVPLDGEPGAQQVPYVVPDDTPDWPRFRDAVLACVQQGIAAVRQAKKQRDLWAVWTFLRSTRIDTDTPQELKSYSETGDLLGLPRERVSQLIDLLKTMVRRCTETAGTESISQNASEPDRPAAHEGARARRQ